MLRRAIPQWPGADRTQAATCDRQIVERIEPAQLDRRGDPQHPAAGRKFDWFSAI